MAARTIVYFGRDRAQIGSWKSSPKTANLVPFPAKEQLPVLSVTRLVDAAMDRGYTSAYTAAMNPDQAEPFLSAGFAVHEELYLLRRPLDEEVDTDRSSTRRARRTDWDAVLELDALAFDDFWQFDRASLADAIKATPRHRFHVTRTTPLFGYHVTGLAGSNGYLQRIAVHPDAQRQGWGTRLVNDALRWAQRSGATIAHVNTQMVNERAVALYERCGFTLAPHRLLVLYRDFENL